MSVRLLPFTSFGAISGSLWYLKRKVSTFVVPMGDFCEVQQFRKPLTSQEGHRGGKGECIYYLVGEDG